MGRPVAHGEPMWTGRDRQIAQAWLEFQAGLCPMCGNPKELCHDLELDGELYGEVVHCHLTAAIARAQKREWERFEGQASEDVEVDTAGAYVRVKRRERLPEEGPLPGGEGLS